MATSAITSLVTTEMALTIRAVGTYFTRVRLDSSELEDFEKPAKIAFQAT